MQCKFHLLFAEAEYLRRQPKIGIFFEVIRKRKVVFCWFRTLLRRNRTNYIHFVSKGNACPSKVVWRFYFLNNIGRFLNKPRPFSTAGKRQRAAVAGIYFHAAFNESPSNDSPIGNNYFRIATKCTPEGALQYNSSVISGKNKSESIKYSITPPKKHNY